MMVQNSVFDPRAVKRERDVILREMEEVSGWLDSDERSRGCDGGGGGGGVLTGA